jgi:hypothetical protein
VGPGGGGEFVVSVAPEVQAAFSDREKNKTPAA